MLVLLTGGSGFIAAHILDGLVKRGIPVVTTVRSHDKAKFLAEKYPGHDLKFEIVSDVAQKDAFDNALKNHKITRILHTASPFFLNPENPQKEILDPAINGTRGILEAAQKYGPEVEHVVITSSNAAITYYDARHKDPETVYTEKCWSNVPWDEAINNPASTYKASKQFAEEAMWTFQKEHKPEFRLTAINPPYVFGPMNHDVSAATLNTSNKIVWDIIKSSSVGKAGPTYWVDVRDVAEAHIRALERPDQSANQRWYTVGGIFTPQDVLDVLNEMDEFKGKIPVGEPGSGVSLHSTIPKYDNSLTNEQSGLKYHTLEQSVKDLAKQLEKLA